MNTPRKARVRNILKSSKKNTNLNEHPVSKSCTIFGSNFSLNTCYLILLLHIQAAAKAVSDQREAQKLVRKRRAEKRKEDKAAKRARQADIKSKNALPDDFLANLGTATGGSLYRGFFNLTSNLHLPDISI